MDFPHLTIPEIDVRIFEVEALGFARHIGGAHHGDGLAIALEIVLVYSETRTGAEVGFVADPEAGMISGANLVAFEELRFDDIQIFSAWRGQHERFDRGDI